MNKSDYENPEEHIFYCDKSDWYDEVHGEKDWSKSKDKVEEFWAKVREEKMAKLDYDFKEFVFPIVLSFGFFNENEYLNFRSDAWLDFRKSKFLGFISFGNVVFDCDVTFHGSAFEGKRKLKGTNIDENEFFSCSFQASDFKHKINLGGCVFVNTVTFRSSIFYGQSFFGGTVFSSASFRDCRFFEETSFYGVTISGPYWTYFSQTVFQRFSLFKFNLLEGSKIEFRGAIFPFDHSTRFENWSGDGIVYFAFSDFTSRTIFSKMDFGKVYFRSVSLRDISIIRCKFPKRGGIHSLNGYQFSSLPIDLKKHIDKNTFMVSAIENHREIKVNRIKARDWTLAGDFYRIEMRLKTKQMWNDLLSSPWKLRLVIPFLVSLFHSWLSGYQQSIQRPLIILLNAWIIFATFYYLDTVSPESPIVWYSVFDNLLDSAFYLLAPLGRIEPKDWEEAQNPVLMRFLIYFERLLGGILLTFFILATRARLKQ